MVKKNKSCTGVADNLLICLKPGFPPLITTMKEIMVNKYRGIEI